MTRTSSWPRRALAVVAAGALAGGAALLPGAGGLPAADAATGTPLTITPQPWYVSEPFQGWGTSLVWFANATGDYPAELREELYQLVFGEDGLNLNIARYNVGGGHASDVVDYLRPGGAVEGWWQADEDGVLTGVPTTYAQREAKRASWDADDPDSYDWDSDATQRWWVERLAQDDQITHWEVFANSAPYFMTESGYVSGGINNATAEQLRIASMDAFATYLTRVSEHLENTYDIDIATIDPFNEPNTNYWSTTFTQGVPTGGRQEGMHVGPARQGLMIDALARVLDDPATTTDAIVSAMDETNPGTFVTNWNAYSPAVRDQVGQMNVHTYGTGGRLQVRDLAKSEDKPLWMSEIEGSWVTGWNPSVMQNGLGLASRVHDDLRELEPDAWVLWQPVEDLYNMEPQGENLNWGTVFIDLDCQAYDEGGTEVFKSARRVADAGGDSTQVEDCSILTNSKYNTMRNFTHFISPGDRLIPTDSTATTAALAGDDSGVTLVHSNAGTTPQTVTVDLSGFGAIAAGASAQAFVTTESTEQDPTSNAMVPSAPVAVDAGSASVTLTLPAQSVSSIVIDGVSGVAEDAAAVQDGEAYQIVGMQSGKALTAGGTSTATSITTVGTTPEAAAPQLWTMHEVPGATREYVLTTADGRALGATTAGTDLREVDVAAAAQNPETVWILNTTNGRTWSLVNKSIAQALEVGGQSTADGAGVGVYGSNGGANQTWQVRNTVATGVEEVRVSTLSGIAPTLPATVVPVYSWGTGSATDVVWDLPGADAWDTTGEVTVTGTAIDVFGNEVTATAIVTVGGYTVTDPVSLTVREGADLAAVRAAAPGTVPARSGASTATFDATVTWDWSEVTAADLATTGVVTVPGSATSNEPGADPLAATLSVLVTDPVPLNVAPLPSTSAAATYTESGYPVDNTRNGVLNDKGWSNWRSGTKNASDTLTYTWTDAEDLADTTVMFYADGSAQSWARSIRLEYRDTDGVWRVVPGAESVAVTSPAVGAPIVPIDASTAGAATGVRVVMTAHADTHMVVSEVEIEVLRAGPADVADLAALRLDGEAVDGFDPATLAYDAAVDGSRFPVLTAVAIDQSASVTVVQPSAGAPGTVTVVSADGSQTRTYTVDIERRVALSGLTVTGELKVGQTVRADVTVDPGDADLTWEWLIDGQPVAGAVAPLAGAVQSSSLVIPADAGNGTLQVSVTGAAVGFTASDLTSEGAVVQPLASDATLTALRLDGVGVAGFDPATSAYTAEVLGSVYPTLSAQAADPTATVAVTQPAAPSGEGRVVVTAEDGTERAYTVVVSRRVAVLSVTLPSSARVGTEVAAAVQADPGEAGVTYQWTLDGLALAGADAAVYTPTADQVGGALAVEVVAAADGFATSATHTSAAVIVAAVPDPGPPGDPVDPGTGGGGSAGTTGDDASGTLGVTGSTAWPIALMALLLASCGGVLLTAWQRRSRME